MTGNQDARTGSDGDSPAFRAGSRLRPDDQEELTLARGRPWLTWLRCRAGRWSDLRLVRYLGWSPLYWLFGHRSPDGTLGGVPILLQTTGRVTGRTRTVVLPAIEHETGWLVCATLGGGPNDPQWARNLTGRAQATIRVRRRDHRVEAHVLSDEERAGIWPWLSTRHPSLLLYQRTADGYGRIIPVIDLRPDDQQR